MKEAITNTITKTPEQRKTELQALLNSPQAVMASEIPQDVVDLIAKLEGLEIGEVIKLIIPQAQEWKSVTNSRHVR